MTAIVSPLAVGVLTGATELDDATVQAAVMHMLKDANKHDLIQAVYDLTGIVVSMANALSSDMDVSAHEILASAIV